MTNPPNDKIYDNNVLELHQIVTNDLENDSKSDQETGLTIPQPNTNDVAPQKEAQIWTYLGVVGGAGTTSLAVQSAWQLAQNGSNVLLVDLDFERGDCAAYLDVPHSMRITELNAAKGRMDESLAATFIQKFGTNLSLISANAEMGGNDLVSPGALLSLLDSVSCMFDTIILDIPPMWRTWTQAAIGASNKFALVCEARVPALHQAKKLSVNINKALSLAMSPVIILNKFEHRSLRGGLTLSDVQKVLGDLPCSQICIDEETLRTAINTGKPAGVVKPNSRYVKSVCAHINKWSVTDTVLGFTDRRASR